MLIIQILEKIERKFINVFLAMDLLCLPKGKLSFRQERKIQERRIKRLMRAAYNIPFYKQRFDSVGLKPKDFKTAEDLYRFPTLSKNELRDWMNAEVGKAKYESYYLDTTSGSSGTPTRIYYSPREKAFNMANWMRVLIRGGTTRLLE